MRTFDFEGLPSGIVKLDKVMLNFIRSWVSGSQHPSSRRMKAIKVYIFTSV